VPDMDTALFLTSPYFRTECVLFCTKARLLLTVRSPPHLSNHRNGSRCYTGLDEGTAGAHYRARSR